MSERIPPMLRLSKVAEKPSTWEVICLNGRGHVGRVWKARNGWWNLLHHGEFFGNFISRQAALEYIAGEED